MKQQPRGFIALISAVIISTVLLTLAVSIGANTFFARFDALNREYKRLSLGFAESCITTVLGKLASNYNYTVSSDPAYSSSLGGVLVSLGTLYGKPAECLITGPTSNPSAVNGKKTFALSAKGNFNGAFSTINATAIAQDPALAPITPPPTCAFNPTAVSVPGGQTVAFAWSTAGSSITSFVMDHSVGSLTPYGSGTGNFNAPASPGVYTYSATVANTGGSSDCSITVSVTAPPPSPSCADTVMIFDRTGSMSSSDRANERNAGNALTNLYAGVSPAPKIGVGSFGGLDGTDASVPNNGQLTTAFSTILSTINSLTSSNSSVGSNLGEAINVGAHELASVRHTPGKEKVLIFVSDGLPNEPTSSIDGDTGFQAPTTNSANNSLTGDQWTAPINAYGPGVATDNGTHRHRYATFGFAIPSGAQIRGIEVKTDAFNASTPATTFFSETFGTGSTVNDIPGWDEPGSDSGSATLAAAPSSGNDSASPDGGRFARIGQDEWICRTINASGYYSLLLSYYWRGDSDTESSDDLIVEYNPSSTNCSTGSGWNTIDVEDLNTSTGAWTHRINTALPASLNNDSSFLIRFRTNTSSSNENGRVDGITLSGGGLGCSLGVDLSWNGGTSWTGEKTQTLSPSLTSYILGSGTDTWGRTWGIGDFTNGNFRTRIRATPSGTSCSVDTLTARVSYRVPTTPSQYATDASNSAKADGVSIFSIHYGDSSGQAFMGQLASNSTIAASNITNASRSGGTATISTASAHRLTANERVQITGVSNNAFNGTFTVVSTPTPTSFTFTLSGSTLLATGGSVKPTNLFISPASSAMTGIFQSIGYQICPAAAPGCSNTGDEDGDGLVDEDDPGCHTNGDANDASSYDPNDSDEWDVPPPPTPPAPPPPPPNISIGSWVEVP